MRSALSTRLRVRWILETSLPRSQRWTLQLKKPMPWKSSQRRRTGEWTVCGPKDAETLFKAEQRLAAVETTVQMLGLDVGLERAGKAIARAKDAILHSADFEAAVTEACLLVGKAEVSATTEQNRAEEAERLRRKRAAEVRRQQMLEAEQERARQEEAAERRREAQNELDPIITELANVQATVQVSGLSEIRVVSTALQEAEDAVMAASDLLVEDGDVLLATAAVKVAQAKVAHAVKVTDIAKRERALREAERRKKQVEIMRLYAAQRDYREFSEFIVDEDLDKIANVIAASEAAESAIEDASELCRSNPEYSGDIDEKYVPVPQYRLP